MRHPLAPRVGMIVTMTAAFSFYAMLVFGPPLVTAARADQKDQIQKAQHQIEAGDYAAAITALQSVVSQEPGSADGHYWLGRAFYENRDFENAVAQGEKAVALDEKSSLYHDWLGRAYGGQADRDRSFSMARKVKKEFQEAVRLDPSNIAARRDLEEFSP